MLPTSLLSKIDKIIEKLIKKTLNRFLEQRRVLYALQFVFSLNTFTKNVWNSFR